VLRTCPPLAHTRRPRAHILTASATTIHENGDGNGSRRFSDCFVIPGDSSTEQTGESPWGFHEAIRETTLVIEDASRRAERIEQAAALLEAHAARYPHVREALTVRTDGPGPGTHSIRLTPEQRRLLRSILAVGIMPPDTAPTAEEEIEKMLAEDPVLREQRDRTLREAEEEIEKMLAEDPVLREQRDRTLREAARSERVIRTLPERLAAARAKRAARGKRQRD